MKLTDSQKQLLTQINQFLKSDKEVFVVKGYAGSGKTFFTKLLVDSFEKNNTPFKLISII
jgi:tRNA A37 threonylcarbamoyladenosine biosynthesis protein TsaE